MSRLHSAYPEYFVEQDRKTGAWSWRANIHPYVKDAFPSESFKGAAKSYEGARALAQAAIAKAMKKYLITKEGE